MTKELDRRALLRGASVLLAPALLSASAAPALASEPPAAALAGELAGDTPVLRLYAEWSKLSARIVRPDPSPNGRELDRLSAELVALEERLAAEPVTCLADLAAKVVALSRVDGFGLSDGVAAECLTILAGGAA